MNKKDLIEVSKAPGSLPLGRDAQKLVGALRLGGWLPKSSVAVLSIYCVTQARMAFLNKKHRKKNGATDVLSFEQPKLPIKGVRFLGDLVLCTAVAKKQAKEQGHSLRFEVAVLLAHGLLHLLGYDHERSTRQARAMAREETKLLMLAGFVAKPGKGTSKRQSTGLIERSKVNKRA
ncbi:MAG: rRNA maturation RNase YbeY [Bdellovibrionota bacterium]